MRLTSSKLLPGSQRSAGVRHALNLPRPARLTSPRLPGMQPSQPGRGCLPAPRQRVVVKFREGEEQRAGQEQAPQVTRPTTAAITPVLFQLHRHCAYGQAWGICGNIPELGSWDPTKAQPLRWTPGDRWTALMYLPEGTHVEFKYVMLNAHDNHRFLSWSNDVCGRDNVHLDVRKETVVHLGPCVVNMEAGNAETAASMGEVSGQTQEGTARPESLEHGTTILGMPLPSAMDIGRPVTPEPVHSRTTGELIRDTVRPLVDKVSGTLERVLHHPGEVHASRVSKVDEDRADPANEQVMTQQHAHEPAMARHIQSDTLTTDRELARQSGATGDIKGAGELPYMDQSSLEYRPTHPHQAGGTASGRVPEGSRGSTANIPHLQTEHGQVALGGVDMAFTGPNGAAMGPIISPAGTDMPGSAPRPTPPAAETTWAAPSPALPAFIGGVPAAAPPSNAPTPTLPGAGGVGATAGPDVRPSGSAGRVGEPGTTSTATGMASGSVAPGETGDTTTLYAEASGASTMPATGATTTAPGGGTYSAAGQPAGAPATMGGTDVATHHHHTAAELRYHTPASDVHPAYTHEEAQATIAADAGLEMPISISAATAASILSNMVGGDEEVPMAPLASGVTPTTGASASKGSSVLNPKHNPLIMAASFFTTPAQSLFNKMTSMMAVDAPPPSAAGTARPLTPEAEEAVAETGIMNAGPVPAAPSTLSHAAHEATHPSRRSGGGAGGNEGGDEPASAPESGTAGREGEAGKHVSTRDVPVSQPASTGDVEAGAEVKPTGHENQGEVEEKDDPAHAPESGTRR